MSKIGNKPSHVKEEKAELLRGAIGHRAVWMGLTYDEAKKAGKAEDGEKFARAAISRCGFMHGMAFKDQCSTNPVKISEFANIFLAPTLKNTFEIEVMEKSDEKLEMNFHFCPLLKAWQDLGLDDETCGRLCDIAMEGDRNIAKALDLDFKLGDTIANGCPTCHITFIKKK